MVADGIAKALAGVYAELVSGSPRSEILSLDLRAAPSSQRLKRLIIAQCDHETELCGMIRAWWIAEEAGVRRDRSPFGSGELPEDFAVEHPMIRFATNGQRIRIGARLGPHWYWVKFGQLGGSGELVAASLIDEFVAA
jgi:hypothetical protein